MTIWVSVVSIAGAVGLGAMSPGPSFLLVAKTAVSKTRADGLWAAIGIGAGGIVYTVAALVGLRVLLETVPAVYLALKVLGGAYLVYLALMIWRGAKRPLDGSAQERTAPCKELHRSFAIGLFTQLSNPKAAIAYAGIFAALMPASFPLWANVLLVLLVFFVEGGWYSLVAWVLSTDSTRQAYLRWKTAIDRLTGGVLGLLGIKLMVSAAE